MNSNMDSSLSPITIGRVDSNKISIKSNKLSRHQCQIEYKQGFWEVVDGDGTKHSTNGTWIFIEKPYEIYEGMVFKAGQTLFECHYLR